MRRRPPASWIRIALALALALAFAAVDLLAAIHQASERHVVCAEHGELVHTGDLDVSAVAPRAPSLQRPGIPAPAHDRSAHCRLVMGAHDGECTDDTVAGEVLASVGSENAPAVSTWWRPGKAYLLALAPKTSPPST